MNLWGKAYTKQELMQNVGDISQVCGVRRAILDDGPGRGMRVFDVRTGGGVTFSVLPDRGMDIGICHYNGIPVSFISKTGAVSPYLCEYPGNGFLRGFTAGLLTTCGYTHMGAACVDEGQALGLHGRASTLVADQAAATGYWQNDDYIMQISGTMREAAVFGENIQVQRNIRVKAGENKIIIHDTVENCGFDSQPFMLLYHINLGHPLVGPDTQLIASDCATIRPRDDAAAVGLAQCRTFQAPTHGYQEQVFYYDLIPDKNGSVFAGLYNNALQIAATVRFQKEQLPHLITWKQMGEGDYTCGIEPSTWYPEGRDKARARGELIMLAPGERREFTLEIAVDTGAYPI